MNHSLKGKGKVVSVL